MARNYVIPGPVMVYVKFGEHVPASFSNVVPGSLPGSSSSDAPSNICELGLSSDSITISPKLIQHDTRTDDYGPDVPADIMVMGAECEIGMTLIHQDPNVVDLCLAEAMGGPCIAGGVSPQYNAGTLSAVGTPLGGALGNGAFASGNHFISLNLVPGQVGQLPWRFPNAFLRTAPASIPVGVKVQMTQLNWRAIPCPNVSLHDVVVPGVGGTGRLIVNTTVQQPTEIVSSGAVLWDHGLDT